MLGLPIAQREEHQRAADQSTSRPNIILILADDSVTIAEALRPAGYRTLMSGKCTELSDLAARDRPRVEDLAKQHGAWAESAGVVPWDELLDDVMRLYTGGADVHGN